MDIQDPIEMTGRYITVAYSKTTLWVHDSQTGLCHSYSFQGLFHVDATALRMAAYLLGRQWEDPEVLEAVQTIMGRVPADRSAFYYRWEIVRLKEIPYGGCIL